MPGLRYSVHFGSVKLLEPENNEIGEEEEEEEEEREENVPIYHHRPREDLKEAVTRVQWLLDAI